MKIRLGLALAFVFSIHGTPVFAQTTASCTSSSELNLLDFWLGDWEVVTEDEQPAGINTISKTLSGCAVREQWTGAGGGKGESLFYIDPHSGRLKQLWLTEQALMPGGVKEKALLDAVPGQTARFQGSYPYQGGEILDRTTLTLESEGRVCQHIEISQDNGESWQTTFIGIYIRK